MAAEQLHHQFEYQSHGPSRLLVTVPTPIIMHLGKDQHVSSALRRLRNWEYAAVSLEPKDEATTELSIFHGRMGSIDTYELRQKQFNDATFVLGAINLVAGVARRGDPRLRFLQHKPRGDESGRASARLRLTMPQLPREDEVQAAELKHLSQREDALLATYANEAMAAAAKQIFPDPDHDWHQLQPVSSINRNLRKVMLMPDARYIPILSSEHRSGQPKEQQIVDLEARHFDGYDQLFVALAGALAIVGAGDPPHGTR